jgi:uncharacterized protein (TIRG00374 family)
MSVSADTIIEQRKLFSPTLRSGLAAAAAIALALVSVLLLVATSKLDMATLADRLGRSPGWLICALALLTIAQTTFSACKWRLVLSAYGPDSGQLPGFHFCLFYSALSAFASQLVPAHVAAIIVRSIGAKRVGNLTLGRSAASSAFEQVFDALVLVAFGVATVLTWSVEGGVVFWLGAILAGIAVGYFMLIGVGRARLSGTPTSSRSGLARKLNAFLDEHFTAVLFEARLSAKLLALSLLRYATIMARVPLIVIGMGFALPVSAVSQGFALVQATQIAALAPGNLGLQEWSWAAVLALRGISLLLAAEFALSLRGLTLVAANAGLGLIIVVLLLRRK